MNETTTDILFLAFGAFGIMVALTFLGEVLRARQPVDQQNPVLETYDEIKGHLARVEKRAISDKTMPPSGPANQKALDDLQKWIDEGAPNN